MKEIKKIKLGNKCVGDGEPCFIIAEVGINHNGDVEIAKRMVDAAKNAGVDCVKFQTFKANEFVGDPKLTYTYKSQGRTVTETQIEMFERYEFSKKEWEEIIKYCRKKNIIFSTTAQNPSDLDFISSIADLPFIKVGSDDLTNLGLLKYYASKNKPIIISVGMAYASEIKDALSIIRKTNNSIIVLHCTSSYPTEADEVNLRKIKAIKNLFKVIVGFSDHTNGILASVASVVLGANVVEKHFTLDKNMPGPDHYFSSDPKELEQLVTGIRYIEKSMGNSILIPTKKEIEMRKIARRSIVAASDIIIGQTITKESVEYKRPGTGLAPKLVDSVIGKKAKINIKKGSLITFNNIE